ncbi:MAG: hypothetical protein SO005_10970, partial [Candidatus Choladocola sp.]|nr:hypothetical protein [Candidatus Choladocola sp.]
ILLELSVAENIYLGRMPANRFGVIDTAKANHMAQEIINDFGLPISPSPYARTGSSPRKHFGIRGGLPGIYRQKTEIK